MKYARYLVQCCTLAASLVVLASAGSAPVARSSQATPPELLTIAESSGFTATARYDDVVGLCDRIAEASPKKVRRVELGLTEQGRPIPMMILADPPIETAEQAVKSGKLIVLLIGNIHAGEMCGKEALPILAREILGLDTDAPANAGVDTGGAKEADGAADVASPITWGTTEAATATPAKPATPSGGEGNGDADEGDAKDAKPVRPAHNLLKDLIIVMVPIYNVDGNEKIGPLSEKRPGQNGPEEGDGVGTRENSDGLDLNRDFVKLEAAETRALVKFIAQWDPAIVVDTHTTNGSFHRYTITYGGPTSPAGDGKILRYARDEMLPALVKSMDDKHGIKMFHYGNFEKDHSKWTTYPDLPRYGIPYIGMRNRIGILSEAYAHAPYKDRILATRDVCKEVLHYAAEHKDAIRRLEREADERVTAAGRKPAADDLIPIRSEAKAFPEKATILGFVEQERDGKPASTGEPRDYEVEFVNDFQPKLTVRRPYAYLIPPEHMDVIENLQRHGIRVEELREDIDLEFEAYRIDAVTTIRFPFQNHWLVDVNATAEGKTSRVAAGTYVVRTAQPQGTLAAYLLEPQSTDGLTAWNFFDDQLVVGSEFPVTRVVEQTPLLTAQTRPLDEYREFGKPISYKVMYDSPGGGGPPNFSGSPIGGLRWMPLRETGLKAGEDAKQPAADDTRDNTNGRTRERTRRRTRESANEDAKEDAAIDKRQPASIATPGGASSETAAATDAPTDEWYFQMRDGVILKVNALTGRSEKAYDLAPMTKALASIPTIGEQTAKSLVGPFVNMNADRTAAVFEYENDLYYATLDGSASRLTSSPEQEEQYTFSPDGKFVAFIRSNDLWVVDVQTHTERALTTGGTDLIRNGKNDWVYYEELFNRNWRAYWWSPDSKRLALFQVDSTPVPRFKLQADHAEPRLIEDAPYPEPGEPNPNVKFGIVTVTGGGVRWADFSDYDTGHYLITGVGWFPAEGEGDRKESRAAYCYVQNRTQTWLDLLSVPTSGAKPTRLMRETTQAWVEPQGEPKFLKDGSFLLASERTGFRHLYLFDRKGKLKNAVTQGEWEATSIQYVDEKEGFVYFMGTVEGSITSNLYRVKLDGTEMTRMTFPEGQSTPGGTHSVNFSPSGNYFIDSWSDHQNPTMVTLFRNNGSRIRTLDSNPVYTPAEYERGDFELVQIPARDGFMLEASILLPPGYDPTVKYPVWLQTYAGPHAPTVFDSWQGGRLGDEALAREGVIVFRADPRSASGKGAKSAWTAYKQLGVQELMDLEDAVKWLCERPYVDSTRVGISGGSYGGFMTVYALTHSKVFSAGVAISSPTDWRNYDSVYTERYMDIPQENPDGYEKSSVVKAARNLHGKLLLIHGTMDDNVHMLNSLKLVRALQSANKQFEFMLYPGSRHGVGGGHYRATFYDFIRRTFNLENQEAAEADRKP